MLNDDTLIDDMFYSYEESKEDRLSSTYDISMDIITNNMIRLFFKENKYCANVINVKSSFKKDFNDDKTLGLFAKHIAVIKADVLPFLSDVYYNNSIINKNVNEKTYITYANKMFNTYLVSNVLMDKKDKARSSHKSGKEHYY